METGLFCGTFGVFHCAEFLFFRQKSNNETPKNIPERGLTSLRTFSDYSLEFPYCFWTRNFSFSQLLTSGSGKGIRFRGP